MAFNSKTNLKILDLLCEGPIEGVVNGLLGVYLDETQITRSIFDEDEVRGEIKLGTPNQTRLNDEFFKDGTSQIVAVNQQVGESYSEEVDQSNLVTKRNYGKGQLVRTITDPEVDEFQLVFSIPRLFCTGAEGIARGQLFPARIKFEVSVQEKGGSYRDVTIVPEGELQEDEILDGNIFTGISTNGYQFKSQPISLTNSQGRKNAPWNIRVKKLEFTTPEGAFEIRRSNFRDLPENTPLQQGRADVFVWDYIITSRKGKVNYKHSACVALSISSEQYNSLPARSYDIKGKKVQIPSNAAVREDGSLSFTDGVPFDGQVTTSLHWTTCPVCCFYDMVTNARYGAGDFVDQTNISWIDLIDIAKYCNELIDLGDGTKEPRFALNTTISSQAEAYSVIQDLASVFRGMVYWRADTVQLAADHGNLDGTVLNPLHVFNNSNVVGGGFSYSGSSLKTRSTRVVVRYNDPENFYKSNFVIVEDRAALAKYGLQQRETIAFGCTSKTQAQRMGKWLMKSEEIEGETVAFSVGLEGLNVLPGQIFAVSDSMRQGARISGRIVAATRNTVYTDAAITSPSGTNDQMTIVLPDGRVQVRTVASIAGTRVDVTSPFDEPPVDGSVFALTDSSVANQKFRCLSVAEGEGGIYQITGVLHVDNIYDVVEGADSDLKFEDITVFDENPLTPIGLQIEFFDVSRNRNRFKQITISWRRGVESSGLPDPRTVSYDVEYKITSSGNWIKINTTNLRVDVDANVSTDQRIYVRIRAVGPEPRRLISVPLTGNASPTADAITDTPGGAIVQVLPPDVNEVFIEPIGTNQVILSWVVAATGQDLSEFVAVVRHAGRTDGTGEWYNASLLRKVEARVGSITLPLLEGEYLIKLENRAGLRSANAVSVVVDLPDSLPRFNFETIQEADNNFPGHRVGVYYDDSFDGLVLDGDASFDDEVTSLDALAVNIDSIFGTQRTSGTYYFAGILDFGAKFSPLFKRLLDSVGVYKADTIDTRFDLIDTWTDFDGDIADDTNVQIYLRASDAAPSASAVGAELNGDSILLEDGDKALNTSDTSFGNWVLLENTNFVGRQFQFKAELTTGHVDQTPVAKSLGVVAQLEQRTENSGLLTSLAAETTVNFTDSFYVDDDTKSAVGITAYNMLADDYFVLSEPTASGFTISFKGGAAGTDFVSRTFRYTAVGYGKAQT